MLTHYSYIPNHNEINHNIGVGMHALCFGSETNIRFGKEGFIWSYTPQLLFDICLMKVSYGYDLRIINKLKTTGVDMHRVSQKYGINWTAIPEGRH